MDDAGIGAVVAQLRGSLSQKDLAALMREYGWKWSQATVWSVEKGERPLRLAEAADLATVLTRVGGVPVQLDDFLSDVSPRVALRLGAMQRADRALGDASQRFLEVYVDLRQTAAGAQLGPELEAAVHMWDDDARALGEFVRTREEHRKVAFDGERSEAAER